MVSSKETNEASIPLEAKESKRRGGPMKEQKKSGRVHQEKELPTRRRHESDSDRESADKEKADDVSWNESRRGNWKEKRGRNREATKSGTSRLRSPKGQLSCSSAKGRIPPTEKSVVGRVQLITQTVTEPALVSAFPTPNLATRRTEAMPLTTPACRVKPRGEWRRVLEIVVLRWYLRNGALVSISLLRRGWSLLLLNAQHC